MSHHIWLSFPLTICDSIACPLGTLTCSAADKSLTCITGWAIGASGTCVASGALASCGDGQYWTGTGCASSVISSRKSWAILWGLILHSLPADVHLLVRRVLGQALQIV